MRKYLVVFSAFIIGAMLATPVLSKTATNGAIIIVGGHESWMAGSGAMKGVQVAALSGDPSKPGPYVVRLKIPPNTTLPAHYHGDAENVTVISGTLYVGMGDKVDQRKLAALHPGTFAHLDKGVHHFALTKSDGAVIQINGTGPMTMMMVAGGKM